MKNGLEEKNIPTIDWDAIAASPSGMEGFLPGSPFSEVCSHISFLALNGVKKFKDNGESALLTDEEIVERSIKYVANLEELTSEEEVLLKDSISAVVEYLDANSRPLKDIGRYVL